MARFGRGFAFKSKTLGIPPAEQPGPAEPTFHSSWVKAHVSKFSMVILIIAAPIFGIWTERTGKKSEMDR